MRFDSVLERLGLKESELEKPVFVASDLIVRIEEIETELGLEEEEAEDAGE